MPYDPSKLFLAGATDNSEHNCPDFVYVYFSDTPDEISRDFFEGAGITIGDIVIVGPKNENEKIIIENSCLYEGAGDDRRVYIRPTNQHFFSWLEELDQYKPLSQSESYWKDVKCRFQEQKDTTDRGEKRLQGPESKRTYHLAPKPI